MDDADLIIVGGGLAGGLLAYRLAGARPELRVSLLERGAELGGNHTWSFHSTDLSAVAVEWLRPLISRSWEGYEVRFPSRERSLASAYHAIRAEDFRRVLGDTLEPRRVRTACDVTEISSTHVVLGSGERLAAACVVDARGWGATAIPHGPRSAGYQKFVGLELRLDAAHGVKRPILMDARCAQLEGFRFFYLLPWSVDTLLIEDTRYSEDPALDEPAMEREILAYARERGFRVREILRRERGVLPLPLYRVRARAGRGHGEPPAIGAAAGRFHFTTGYSLPWAVDAAETLCTLRPLTSERARAALRARAGRRAGGTRFHRLLNRMLFQAARPAERYRVLERFYGLPSGLIERFYAGRSSALDSLRLLCGRPPVPVGRALRCVFESRAESLGA